jgi:hypothetical protein
MKDYYKFYRTKCQKKIKQKDVEKFCNFNHKINKNWIKPFCEILKQKIQILTEKYKNLSKLELYELVKKFDKTVKKNTDKETLISKLLFSLKNCHNQLTIYGDKIQQIHPDKLYITSQGYCHDIDELMEYMISTDGQRNIDPLDQNNTLTIWQNRQEKNKIINHKFLDPSIKNRYLQHIKKNNSLLKIDVNDYQQYMNMIAYLAFVCINDHPSSLGGCEFKTATEALGYFSEMINTLSQKNRNFIFNLKNGNGKSVEELLEDTAMCIHKKGDQFLNIYLYNYVRSLSPINLVKFITQIDETTFATVRLYENKLEKFYDTTPIRYIISGFNPYKNEFIQLDRNYHGNNKKYPMVLYSLNQNAVNSIRDALKFFKIK